MIKVIGAPILLSVTAAFIMFGNLFSELPPMNGLGTVKDDAVYWASCGETGLMDIAEAGCGASCGRIGAMDIAEAGRSVKIREQARRRSVKELKEH